MVARRCFNRRTQAVLTENFCATADVAIPASTSFNTRTRKSIEYVFMTASPTKDATLTKTHSSRYIKSRTALVASIG